MTDGSQYGIWSHYADKDKQQKLVSEHVKKSMKLEHMLKKERRGGLLEQQLLALDFLLCYRRLLVEKIIVGTQGERIWSPIS